MAIKDKTTGMWVPGVIYVLMYEENGESTPFYVGETTDPVKRKKQHAAAANNGEERLVYEAIKQLSDNGIPWDLHVVTHYGQNGPGILEDQIIVNCLMCNFSLTNMKKGNANWMAERKAEADNMKKHGFTDLQQYRDQVKIWDAAAAAAKAAEEQRKRVEEEKKKDQYLKRTLEIAAAAKIDSEALRAVQEQERRRLLLVMKNSEEYQKAKEEKKRRHETQAKLDAERDAEVYQIMYKRNLELDAAERREKYIQQQKELEQQKREEREHKAKCEAEYERIITSEPRPTHLQYVGELGREYSARYLRSIGVCK